MKRLETLVKEGRQFLDDGYEGRRPYWEQANGVSAMDIARALDKIKAARETLVKAFGP